MGIRYVQRVVLKGGIEVEIHSQVIEWKVRAARLLKNADELLAALKGALDALEAAGLVQCLEYNAARAAIAKAEGKKVTGV